jgi:2-polyprenyl-6-hydroxyphenyl methylase/3-demethylubiquinone-9 3-methyltransferase
MIAEHEAVVASRFDALHGRFKRELDRDDPRLCAIVESLMPIAGRRILDIGCGKGRFSRALGELGASVVGLDLSAEMLREAPGIDRVRASARRLPFAAASFDGVVAVEVWEHLAARSLDQVGREVSRVLRPGGTLVVVDKNVCSWNARRPWIPGLVIKWIDARRGFWMYTPRDGVRERWFGARALRTRLLRWFSAVRVEFLLSRAERGRFPFEHIPATRLFVLWSARAPGGKA